MMMHSTALMLHSMPAVLNLDTKAFKPAVLPFATPMTHSASLLRDYNVACFKSLQYTWHKNLLADFTHHSWALAVFWSSFMKKKPQVSSSVRHFLCASCREKLSYQNDSNPLSRGASGRWESGSSGRASCSWRPWRPRRRPPPPCSWSRWRAVPCWLGRRRCRSLHRTPDCRGGENSSTGWNYFVFVKSAVYSFFHISNKLFFNLQWLAGAIPRIFIISSIYVNYIQIYVYLFLVLLRTRMCVRLT